MERFSVEYTFYSVRHQFTFSFRHKVYSTCMYMYGNVQRADSVHFNHPIDETA